MILLSWDGTRPDYVDRAETPALDRMRRDGTEAERLTPVFPASTFANHVSLATGAYVEAHGIVGNVFRDPERGLFRYSNDASFIQAEPIWVAAERQGVRAATFFWVGSETDWQGVGATYRKTPFDSSIPESEKVDQILSWIDLPPDRRPGLILSWWHGCDSVSHRWGPEHERVADQLVLQDAQLGRLLAGLDERRLWKETTLIVLSDHGMAAVNEAIDLREILSGREISAKVFNASGMANVFVAQADRPRALEILDALPHVDAYTAESLPGRLHYVYPGRTGDIVTLTTPPRVFASPTFTERMFRRVTGLLGGTPAVHGYDPVLPEMGALFLALGRGVPKGRRIGPQRAIDVAPTVAVLLGIDPPRDAVGHRIEGIGEGR